MSRLNELILRPIFIYKFDKDKEARAREFFHLFQADGDEIVRAFRQAQRDQEASMLPQGDKNSDCSSAKKGFDLALNVEEAA